MLRFKCPYLLFALISVTEIANKWFLEGRSFKNPLDVTLGGRLRKFIFCLSHGHAMVQFLNIFLISVKLTKTTLTSTRLLRNCQISIGSKRTFSSKMGILEKNSRGQTSPIILLLISKLYMPHCLRTFVDFQIEVRYPRPLRKISCYKTGVR